MTEVHQSAARSEGTLRLSCDAKAPVLIGPFSRGGKSRRATRSADHDFKPWGKLTPFDIFVPDQEELNFYFTPSKVTSDLIADRLDQWWQASRELTLPFSLHEHLHRMIERTRAGHLS